ncbi:MAG: hypothetical protein ACLFVZ_08440, partial [Actinomycetota bacterium]
MATERLRVILEMAAGRYKREARQASTATKSIGAEAQTASSRFSGLRSGISKLGPAASVAGVAATAAIGKFTADSIRDASNLQESINAINVVFGDSAEAIHDIGEESAQSFGLSRRAFGEFAVRFSAFADQIADRDGRKVSDVVEEMTGRVADFASVHNISLERAAEVAQSTLAGETEVFRRFGGDVSAAAVETKLLEENIVSSGETISEQDKILGRYMLFMEQTADTAGDFQNTQGEMANAQRTFNAELEDTRAELGEELLPVMADLLATGRDLIPVLVEVGKFIGLIARGAALTTAANDIERVAIASGGAADSAEVLATALVELRRSGRGLPSDYRELFDTFDGGSTEIRTLLDNFDFLVDEMELAEAGARMLEEVLRAELSEA